jgi:hypothetical protein
MNDQNNHHKALREVLDGLTRRYRERVPDVGKVIAAMLDEKLIESENEIENDHIAFRTIGVPQLGIASLERFFLHHGYKRRERLDFPEKKVHAFWYSSTLQEFPRIFISQLHVEDLSLEAQHIIRSYTDEVSNDPFVTADLDNGQAIDELLHRPLWRLPTRADYERLLSESEFAAWVIYNRYYLNHFTIAVHRLRGASTLEAFNAFLERRGIRLNNAGSTIKQSDDGLLLQSSTVAEVIDAPFADSEHLRIAGSYVEFAERRVLPQYRDLPPEHIHREHRRDGFESKNANHIFESTYTSQTGIRG